MPSPPDAHDAQARLDAWMGIITSQSKTTGVLLPRLKREHELSGPQYEILRRLARSPGERLRVKQLADSILYGSGAATNLVHRLVERGLVLRETDGTDGRGVWVKLTDEGRTLIHAARAVQARLVIDLMPPFVDEEERDTVLGYLDRVTGIPFERIPYPDEPPAQA